MKSKKFILVTAILIVGLISLSFVVYNLQNKQKYLYTVSSNLIAENNKLKQENSKHIDTISNLNSDIQKRDEIIKKLPKLEGSMVEELKKKGFNGDVQEIILDLMNHNELIPYEGVLGGKMGFYDESQIYILTDRWVLAAFNDGHIGGYLLLKYDFRNGEISWKVIDSYLMRT